MTIRDGGKWAAIAVTLLGIAAFQGTHQTALTAQETSEPKLLPEHSINVASQFLSDPVELKYRSPSGEWGVGAGFELPAFSFIGCSDRIDASTLAPMRSHAQIDPFMARHDLPPLDPNNHYTPDDWHQMFSRVCSVYKTKTFVVIKKQDGDFYCVYGGGWNVGPLKERTLEEIEKDEQNACRWVHMQRSLEN